MNQQSKFKVKVAVTIVTAFLLFYGTQFALTALTKWAATGIPNDSNTTSYIREDN